MAESAPSSAALPEDLLRQMRAPKRLSSIPELEGARFPSGAIHLASWAGWMLLWDGSLDWSLRVEGRALHYLNRHRSGDWGILPEAYWSRNEQAIASGVGRICSCYLIDTHRTPYLGGYASQTPLLVLTELERSHTLFFAQDDLR